MKKCIFWNKYYIGRRLVLQRDFLANVWVLNNIAWGHVARVWDQFWWSNSACPHICSVFPASLWDVSQFTSYLYQSQSNNVNRTVHRFQPFFLVVSNVTTHKNRLFLSLDFSAFQGANPSDFWWITNSQARTDLEKTDWFVFSPRPQDVSKSCDDTSNLNEMRLKW